MLEESHGNELAGGLRSALEQSGFPLMIYKIAALQPLTRCLEPPFINEAARSPARICSASTKTHKYCLLYIYSKV